jgi:hypothetical protein
VKADLFSGEVFEANFGVDFVETYARADDLVEHEPEAPWEGADDDAVTLVPYRPIVEDPRFVNAARDQGWANLVLQLRYLSRILKVDVAMFQLNHYDEKTGKLIGTRFTIQAKEPYEGII